MYHAIVRRKITSAFAGLSAGRIEAITEYWLQIDRNKGDILTLKFRIPPPPYSAIA